MAARIQAKVLFGHVQLPKTDRLWAEAMHWACEALNHTACSANPDSKSPYEMWYGEARPARPYPFLKPAYCKWQRPSKLLPKGFEQSLSDPCVLRFMMGDEVMGIIAIHVDDILYAGTKRLAEVIVEALGDSLPTKILGKVRFFLGCAFSRDREAGTIEISQESYIRSVLERFNICRTSSIPASPANDSRSVMEDEEAGDVPFREVVGCLMWIANNTRPETSNAVRTVARHSHEPKKSDWKAAQKILSCLKETAHLTLKYKQDTTVDVGTLVYVDADFTSKATDRTLVYVDADFASKATDRRSVSGALVLVAGCLVSWFSWTQKCVSLSTSEAEYIAMGDGVKEALFVNGMLQFLRPSAKPRKVDPGRTRKQTRELRSSEEEPSEAPAPEEALLSTVLETENGPEIVAENIRESLLEERMQDEQAHRELELVFSANEKDDGSPQPLLDPELSIPSQIGQKPNGVEGVPLTYKGAMDSKYKVLWEAAMMKENGGLGKAGTFTKIGKLPEGRKAVTSKWVFSYETNEKGMITAFKARMVARGFSQIPGVDFHHSASACPSTTSIKTVVVVATEKNMKMFHWDMKQTYIHATKLKEEIFIRLPQGCGDMSGKVDNKDMAGASEGHVLPQRHEDLSSTFVRGSGLDLGVWVDASYADDVVDRHSTTGLAVTVGGNTVNGTTKTKRVPAQSSSEAEYLAAGEGVKEALHVRAVLSFVAPETSGEKIKVLEDNKGALALVQNPFSSARSKHIDVRYHFIPELFKSGKITAEYVPTEEQHADMLIKVLGRTKLE
ncbi:unnamed protein product [Ectocarpus sp. CCAP 1310/34]|nr:unnamed protein product [Ectocarpus sp. CCAP 1310/34]